MGLEKYMGPHVKHQLSNKKEFWKSVHPVPSYEGGQTLWRMGYRHTFEKKNKCSSLWRCSNRKCPGSVTWVEEDGTVARDSDHSCLPDFDAFKVAKIMEEIKKAVCDDYGPIQQIFEKYVKEFRKATEYDEVIPTFNSVKDTLYRARKKHLEVHATIFKTLETVVLPRKLTENFLLIEDGSTDKIVIFCSTEAKDTINRVSDYYADGTFKVAPKPFVQIYSLHGEVGGNPIIVPLVFALLPNKQERTYERLFMLLRQHLPQMNPLHFHSDFEMASMNAFQKVFPCVTVHGCFFHYAQALRKNAKKANLYNTKEQKETIALYTALAHLPPAHIPEGFFSINFEISSDKISAWDDFVGYYVKQWMKYDTVAIMSCYGRPHRTTNVVEGWHSRLNKIVGSNKPHLFPIIKILKDESVHCDYNVRMNNLHLPISKKQLNKFKLRDDRIKKITDDYLTNRIDVNTCLMRLSKVRLLK